MPLRVIVRRLKIVFRVATVYSVCVQVYIIYCRRVFSVFFFFSFPMIRFLFFHSSDKTFSLSTEKNNTHARGKYLKHGQRTNLYIQAYSIRLHVFGDNAGKRCTYFTTLITYLCCLVAYRRIRSEYTVPGDYRVFFFYFFYALLQYIYSIYIWTSSAMYFTNSAAQLFKRRRFDVTILDV